MVGEQFSIDYKLSMPENPKEKKEGAWENDQKERGYYYDDAHGYEDYDPEEADNDGETPRCGDAGNGETRGHGDTEADSNGS